MCILYTGASYGLLNSSTFDPTPSYFAAFFAKRIFSTGVMQTHVETLEMTGNSSTESLRSYAFCANQRIGNQVQSLSLSILWPSLIISCFSPLTHPTGNLPSLVTSQVQSLSLSLLFLLCEQVVDKGAVALLLVNISPDTTLRTSITISGREYVGHRMDFQFSGEEGT